MIDFELAAGPAADPDHEDDRLRMAAESAVGLVEGCEHASLTVVEGRDLVTHAASDTAAARADPLQRLVAEGPSWDARRGCRDVVALDLGADERWPRWSAEVRTELGVASVVSLWVCTEGRSYGALNLYGRRPGAFAPEHLHAARALAARVGVGVDAGRRWDALAAPDPVLVVGRAQGVLMERLGVDAQRALESLRQTADAQGVDVGHVAAQVVGSPRFCPAPPQPEMSA